MPIRGFWPKNSVSRKTQPPIHLILRSKYASSLRVCTPSAKHTCLGLSANEGLDFQNLRCRVPNLSRKLPPLSRSCYKHAVTFMLRSIPAMTKKLGLSFFWSTRASASRLQKYGLRVTEASHHTNWHRDWESTCLNNRR